ncbi:MAG: septum formation inhibitor Maf [Gammaproteobacteria bacterium]|nr:septum formation inhibitor Maf [Gammaproteobacteria bacterium]
MNEQRLYLASKSPRRRALLEQIGLRYELLDIDIDESPHPGEAAADHVCRLALEKARAGAQALLARGKRAPPVTAAPDSTTDGTACSPTMAPATPAPAWVLGADTVVVIGGSVLGKPSDSSMARTMLRRLSNRSHEVMTAVSVVTVDATPAAPRIAPIRVALSRTEVRFRALARDEIDAYVQSGEPLDKAGAYAIQGLAAMFVQSIHGSYSGVMGLPLFETTGLLRSTGFKVPLSTAPTASD